MSEQKKIAQILADDQTGQLLRKLERKVWWIAFSACSTAIATALVCNAVGTAAARYLFGG